MVVRVEGEGDVIVGWIGLEGIWVEGDGGKEVCLGDEVELQDSGCGDDAGLGYRSQGEQTSQRVS